MSEYVDSMQGYTLVGRAWDLNEATSREDLKGFLLKHTKGVVTRRYSNVL